MGHNSYRVFEDWVGLMFHAFQHDDPEYLKIMGGYRNAAPMGEREADHFAAALCELLAYMQATNTEALGPLYEEYAANHYAGQFFTPPAVAQLMARMTQNPPAEGLFTVHDPACGAGACLVAAAKEQTFEQNNRAFFSGIDIDVNCVRMAALNLMFFNLDGLVIWGNALSLEVRGAWQTTRSVAWGGSLRPVDAEQARQWLAQRSIHLAAPVETPTCAKNDTKKRTKPAQLTLFQEIS